MKNIIFVTNYFGNGGAATVMKTIIENLPQNEYNIKLISFLDDQNKYDIPAKVKYIKLSSSLKASNFQKIKSILKLRKILKKEKNSIIISFEYFINIRTILANLFLKNKLIISERNDPSKSGNNKKNIRNFLYNFADILVCQTSEAKEYFPQKIQNKSVIIPNPIKNDLPKPHNGKRKNVIVSFCRVEKQKNLPLMIDAFQILNKKYPYYTLIIYGDGSEKENIQKYIEEKNLTSKVTLKPFTPNLHETIKDCALFVSSSDYEGISNSMIEAMAIGLPVVCTDCPCGGAKMMIDNYDNGILVEVNNVHELSNAMIEIINNKELSKKLSLNAVKIKEKLSQDKIIKEWEKLL